MLASYSRTLRERAIERYYDWARTTPVGRRVHHTLRVWRHERRYRIKTEFMFQSVELEVNSMCNRKCSYCPNVTDKRPPGYMKDDLFRKIIDELGEMDFTGRISYHFYGEPLLDKRLPGFVKYTRDKAPHSSSEIYSNGDFLTLDVFRKYVDAGLDNFLITQHDNI